MKICSHDKMFDLPCGKHPCPDCGEIITVGCDGNDGRCKVCTAPAAPALSQIRDNFHKVLYAKTWDIYQKAQDYETMCEQLLSIADMLERRAADSEAWFKDELSKLEHIRVENERLKKQMAQAIRGLRHYTMWTHLGTDTAKSALRSIAQMEEGKTETPV